MLHSIQYSVITHLKTLPVTGVVWAYSGVSLTDKVTPFATVEHVNSGVTTLDKRAKNEATSYNFQVGVYCGSADELARLQSVVKRKLIGDIPLYNTDGETPVLTGQLVRGVVLNVVPLPAESVEDITKYHRCYLDLQITELEEL